MHGGRAAGGRRRVVNAQNLTTRGVLWGVPNKPVSPIVHRAAGGQFKKAPSSKAPSSSKVPRLRKADDFLAGAQTGSDVMKRAGAKRSKKK